MPDETAGNQKWKGAAPNLISRAEPKSQLQGKYLNQSGPYPPDIIINTDSNSSKEEKA
jgi:hypothetical protein